MPEPLHHIHKRRRINKPQPEPYPHQQRGKRILDIIIYPAGIIGPLLLVPQVIKIWTTRDATGVSAITFFGLMALGLIWIIYGAVHKDRPILIANVGFAILQFLVGLGAVLYG